jgi:hypothetical protein
MRERRRRSDDDADRGGLPLFPLVLIVILAGLLLGGALAHFLGGAKDRSSSAVPAVAALPSPTETPTPILTAPRPIVSLRATLHPLLPPTATPTAVASATPTASPTLRPTPMKTAKPGRAAASPAAKAILSPASAATPALGRAVSYRTPVPTPTPTPTPATVTPDDLASTLVRSYIDAVARGDRTTAASYLSQGLPSETWLNSESRIESIHSTSIGPQQYRVTADIIQTNGSEYYMTFTVEQGAAGLQITDHYTIKPQ